MLHSRDETLLPKTYMDGVPVKISEQYKPPRRVTLPQSCQHCAPSNVLAEQYDFTLENSVLKNMSEWRKARKEETEKRKQRLTNSNKVCGDVQESIKEETRSVDPLSSCISTILSPLPSDILKPTTVKHPPPIPTPNTFNISDFETDTSSPFDNMELKTINEMEILASVLQQPHVNNNVEDKGVRWNSNHVSNGYHPPWNQYSVRQDVYNNHYDLYPLTVNYQTNDFSHQLAMGLPSQPPPLPSSNSLNSTQQHSAQGYAGQETLSERLVESKAKKTWKSVPDIVEELERELREKRILDEKQRLTKTPPPVPYSKVETARSKTVEAPRWKPLPDPTRNLDPESLALARHIGEMGFPLARLARACQRFNNDDKKVIEFALLVQSLEEKNYPGDIIETTLVLKPMEEDEVVRYLDATMVLLDFGFDLERIQSCLVQTDCDKDKALDLLIS